MADINLGVGGANSATGGYDIDNSLKLEPDNSEYLNRTSGANGSRTTWTTSVWVKRTEIGVNQAVISSVASSSQPNFYRFLDSDKIRFYFAPDDVAATYYADTNAVFRDTSAWYHIVWGLDSTNSDGSKRFVVYVNGVYQESTWGGSATASTNCPHNSGSLFLQSQPIFIGRGTYGADHYFSGYMAELHVLDGIAPDPTDFGEFDEDSGIWKPKAYTGSHGTQGFYLDFESSGSLGADSSGNGNNFTLNNITSADQATDTPTNNFATWNPLYAYSTNPTLTEGATKTQEGTGTWAQAKATMGVTSGKWYWEYKMGGSISFMGVQDDTASQNAFAGQYSLFLYNGDTTVEINDTGSLRDDTVLSYTFSTSNIYAVALNMDDNEISYYQNGSIIGSAISLDGLADRLLLPYIGTNSSTNETNFGGYTTISISTPASDANGYGTFEYAPPSGYYALCSKNLAEFG